MCVCVCVCAGNCKKGHQLLFVTMLGMWYAVVGAICIQINGK